MSTLAERLNSGRNIVDDETCDHIRLELLRGRMVKFVAQDDGMPSKNTVSKHARGQCRCRGEQPALEWTGSEWEVSR